MSDFSKPFAEDVPNDRRRPTEEERALGFPCGPLDVKLFNGLFHALQAEMKTLADAAGVEGDDADHNLLRDAVNALIAAATGSGDTSQFVLYSQAQGRLPIHFEILSSDGKINVSSPAAGTIRVPGGVGFVHRGIFRGNTTQTDFAVSANRNYHVRWKLNGGFVIENVGDGTYNPLSLPEADAYFDGTYDNALIARVVTNASNIATITPLVNRPRLASTSVVTGTNFRQPGQNMANADFSQTLNWSRTPDIRSISPFSVRVDSFDDRDRGVYAFGGIGGSELPEYPVTRYNSRFTVMHDAATSLSLNMSFGA